MHPMLVSVEAREGRRIRIEYDDGVSGEIDLEPLMRDDNYAALRDPQFFAQVRLDGYGDVVWGEDLRLNPEQLYADLRGISLEAQEAIWDAAEPRARIYPRPISVKPCDGYRILLTYDDGVSGEVDLSHLINLGMFKALRQRSLFEQVGITEHGAIGWSPELELCPDSLYLRVTGAERGALQPRTAALPQDA